MTRIISAEQTTLLRGESEDGTVADGDARHHSLAISGGAACTPFRV